MPREGVTLAQVEEVMNELDSEQQPSSYRRIRAKLGEGSLTTIANHVREIRRQRQVDELPIDSELPPLPDTVIKGMFAGAGKAWDELLEAAEDIINEAKTQCDEKQQLADTAAQQAIELRDEAETENKRLSESLATAESELSVLTKTYERLRTEHQELLTRFERSSGELEAAQTNNKQLNERLDRAETVVNELHRQRSKLDDDHKSELSRVEQKNDKLNTALQTSVEHEKSTSQELRETLAEIRATTEHLNQSLSANERKLNSIQGERDIARKQLQKNVEELTGSVSKVAQLSEKNESLLQLLERQESGNALLIAAKDDRLAEQGKTIIELRKENSQLREKKKAN